MSRCKYLSVLYVYRYEYTVVYLTFQYSFSTSTVNIQATDDVKTSQPTQNGSGLPSIKDRRVPPRERELETLLHTQYVIVTTHLISSDSREKRLTPKTLFLYTTGVRESKISKF
jgi:hypothetical protein